MLLNEVYKIEMERLEALMLRKARYWEALAGQDRFKLSDEENARLQKRMDAIAEEITLLEKIRNIIPDLANEYVEHTIRLHDENKELRAQCRAYRKTESLLISALYSEIVKPISA